MFTNVGSGAFPDEGFPEEISKEDKNRQPRHAATAAGGAAAYGGYLGGGNAVARINDKISAPRYAANRQQNDKKVKAVKRELGIPRDKKVLDLTTEQKNKFFANYPKDVPGGQIKRVQAKFWGAHKYGKARVVVPVVAAGAATSTALTHRKRVSKMSPDPSELHVMGAGGRGRLRQMTRRKSKTANNG